MKKLPQTKRLPLGIVAAGSLTLLASCIVSLDTFVHNATHCSTVSPATCEDVSDVNQRICTACDADYDWANVGIEADVPVQVTVTLDDGETNDAYFIPSSGAHPDITLVYGHGNRAGIEHYLNRVGILYGLGVNLFVVDYRGYGKSSDPNEPSEEQLYADILRSRAALDTYLEENLSGQAQQIFYFGYSVGALPIMKLAVEVPPCALMLEAPWPSVQAFSNDSTHMGVPASFLTTGVYDNIARVEDLKVPLLIVHGKADDFVLYEHTEVMFAAANEPKKLIPVEGAGHGNFGDDVPTVMGEDAYRAAFMDFMTEHACPATP